MQRKKSEGCGDLNAQALMYSRKAASNRSGPKTISRSVRNATDVLLYSKAPRNSGRTWSAGNPIGCIPGWPSIRLTARPEKAFGGAAALAKSNQVDIRINNSTATSTQDRYILTTTSASNTIFSYVRDESAKTFKCKGTAIAAAFATGTATHPGCTGVYAGTSTGQLYHTADAGETWAAISEHLPPILSVAVSN